MDFKFCIEFSIKIEMSSYGVKPFVYLTNFTMNGQNISRKSPEKWDSVRLRGTEPLLSRIPTLLPPSREILHKPMDKLVRDIDPPHHARYQSIMSRERGRYIERTPSTVAQATDRGMLCLSADSSTCPRCYTRATHHSFLKNPVDNVLS